MTPADDKGLDPDQARFMARVKLLMALSGLATFLGIAVVLGIVGYKLFRGSDVAPAAEATAIIPKGARIVSTAVAGDRIVVTVEAGGVVELRTFEAQTLRPVGRLRFAIEP